jgi:hypothetical protein
MKLPLLLQQPSVRANLSIERIRSGKQLQAFLSFSTLRRPALFDNGESPPCPEEIP